jgi:hypothetical protein
MATKRSLGFLAGFFTLQVFIRLAQMDKLVFGG